MQARGRYRRYCSLRCGRAERGNRRRMRVAAVEHMPYSRWEIYERDRGVCWLCNVAVAFESFQIDHVLPICQSGPDRADNVRVAHKLCNLRRPKWAPPEILRDSVAALSETHATTSRPNFLPTHPPAAHRSSRNAR